jgi:hypothetical protein
MSVSHQHLDSSWKTLATRSQRIVRAIADQVARDILGKSAKSPDRQFVTAMVCNCFLLGAPIRVTLTDRDFTILPQNYFRSTCK